MDRRWFGALVVACAVLASIVLPNVSARRVAGSATAVAIEGPPSPGMCVLSMTDPWRFNPAPGFAVGRIIAVPTAQFGSCDRTVVGEVVSVDAAAGPPERMVDNDYQTSVSQCSLDAIGYLGSIPPVVDRGAGQPSIVWTSVLTFQYSVIGPTTVQRAAGQRWSACAAGSTGATPYRGRLRDVLSTGVLPPVFGSCWDLIESHGPTQTACDSTHAVELLGWANLGSMSVTAAELRPACAAYASRVLRTSDPTRNGVIRPEILLIDQSAAIPADAANLEDLSVACVMMAEHGRQFINTLVGIGERPLPLA